MTQDKLGAWGYKGKDPSKKPRLTWAQAAFERVAENRYSRDARGKKQRSMDVDRVRKALEQLRDK